MEKYKPTEIEAIVADIRNKLSPLCNLAHIVNHSVLPESKVTEILKIQAVTAIENEEIIRAQLEKLVQIGEKEYNKEDMWQAYVSGNLAEYNKWKEGMKMFGEWLEEYKHHKTEKQ